MSDVRSGSDDVRVDRRGFLVGGGAGVCGVIAAAGASGVAASGRAFGQVQGLEENRLDPKMVSEYVGKCHGAFPRVKELVKQEPGLINSAWDWYLGDWETGLGAAAHTGRRGIAEFLLEHGHRMDVYCAAMLGELGYVRAVVETQPELMNVLGPHGIPLTSHARVGKSPECPAVYDYLLERGAVVDLPISKDDLAVYAGTYVDARSGERIEFLVSSGALRLRREHHGRKMYRALHQGNNAFIAGDLQEERMDFAIKDGESVRVVVRDGEGERVLERTGS